MKIRKEGNYPFIGLRPPNINEAMHLRNKGNTVHHVGNSKSNGRITRGHRTFDLASLPELEAFLSTIGLSIEKSKMLTHAIHSIPNSKIKDELAQLAVLFSSFEKRKKGPNRLIISGHHSMGNTWGANGSLPRYNLKTIFDLFPSIAASIEDMHISGCNSGNYSDMMKWREIFPNVKTIWAYIGNAPLTGQGSRGDMAFWDTRTRGNKEDLIKELVKRADAQGTNVAVWSSDFDYHSRLGIDFQSLETLRASISNEYHLHFDGTKNVDNPHGGPVREYYTVLSRMAGHRRCPPDSKKGCEEEAEEAFRLLYFDKSIKKKFYTHYKQELDAGYRRVGLEPVDYSILSRKECLKKIHEYYDAHEKNQAPESDRVYELLYRGLKMLESKHIPSEWAGE